MILEQPKYVSKLYCIRVDFIYIHIVCCIDLLLYQQDKASVYLPTSLVTVRNKNPCVVGQCTSMAE